MNNIDDRIKKILSEEQVPPIRFDYKVEKTLNCLKTKRILNFKILKLCISTLCCFVVILTSVVWAKDIENYIKKLFVNSTDAIDSAVEEGYVQEVDNDYTYDNNIGIKVDRIILDDLYLDISFNFNVDDTEIKNIRFKEFLIETENGKKIYESEFEYTENIEEIYLAQSVNWFNQAERISDTVFIDSILFGMREKNFEIKELKFNINKLDITYSDNTKKELTGNWQFNVVITDDMKVDSIEYSMTSSNQYIEKCIGKLYSTGLEIEIELNEPFDSVEYIKKNLDKIDDVGVFYLKYNSQKLSPNYFHGSNQLKTQYLLRYDDISIFSENINVIELYLEPFDSTIVLEKSK